MADANPNRGPSLAELAFVFLKLGTIAFGGPAAHIAMMEEKFVRRRKWLSETEFLDRLAAANLIPGPSSTELGIFVGHLKRGWRGLIVAGCCFIIPAAVLVSMIAWAYVRFGALPPVEAILYAIKPVVAAIIVQALWKFARTGVRTLFLGLVAAMAVIASLLGVSPILILMVAGIVSSAAFAVKGQSGKVSLVGLPKVLAVSASAVAAGVAIPVSLMRLFLSFLKIGSVVFGSGYVLLAFLRSEFVERLHWLTERQLIDAVAVGQFTPGPLFTTATFIGYIVAGWRGAFVATVGIFVPGFLLVAMAGPLIPKLRRAPMVAAALDGVVAASIALMAVVTWQLGKAALVDRITMAIFVVSVIALLRFRVNSAVLVVAAGGLGWTLQALR
ncbi:MAG: chromate efflux transporter [Acidobacteria bacterium]|nr:chromate efflux transporter [Acidobacteriota bacterium]